jgi:hypothetical protein
MPERRDANLMPYSVQIGNLHWATRNVDFSRASGFTEHPADDGMFFQWNRLQGWTAGTWSPNGLWSDLLVQAPFSAVTTPPAYFTNAFFHIPSGSGNWVFDENTDPCSRIPGGGWRMPTNSEMTMLGTIHNQFPWLLGEIAGNRGYPALVGVGCAPGVARRCATTPENGFIFLPAAGYLSHNAGGRGRVGLWGYYWTRTPAGISFPIEGTQSQARSFHYHGAFGPASNNLSGWGVRQGFNVRCVRDTPAPSGLSLGGSLGLSPTPF